MRAVLGDQIPHIIEFLGHPEFVFIVAVVDRQNLVAARLLQYVDDSVYRSHLAHAWIATLLYYFQTAPHRLGGA